MNRFLLTCALTAAATVASVASAAEPNAAEHYRIFSQVYVGASAEPTAENLTLYSSAAVYDFLIGGNETAILDFAKKRFYLLDGVRQVQTEIDCQTLHRFNFEARADIDARPQISPIIRFAARPKYDVQYDARESRLELRSGVIDYRVDCVAAPRREVAESFRIFADWYAQLNATRVGALPPYARSELNAELLERGLLPSRVTRTLHADGKTFVARSQHELAWKWEPGDRKRVEEATRWRRSFKSVSFSVYRRIETARQPNGGHK